ncbi:hypothetical protein [Bosea sp. ANAM02]|uniref:hypothetical protein n=1 Tax=Bosea sp. ANAM02 TaxID=2020412 RepID=UPI00140EB4D0|nr:hypothetical protein [Bosea sp. ANAM02]BCB22274.1 hypothetical protein OCUBac02_51680 [Bosea sp. ANAM02]
MRNPIRYAVGDQVAITAESFARIRNDNRNRTAGRTWTSDGVVENAEAILAAGALGVVTHTFPPGYSTSVLFDNGLHMHMREDFIEPAAVEPRPASERLAELSAEIVKATSLGKNPDLRVLSLIVGATRDLQKEARPEVLIEVSDGIATVAAVNGSVTVAIADLDVDEFPDDLDDTLAGDEHTGSASELEAAKTKFREELAARTGGPTL